MIVALMSTYREGNLALAAARSVLPACDALVLYEGAVGEPAAGGDPTPVGPIDAACAAVDVRYWHEEGEWETDAGKRTALLELATEVLWGGESDAKEPFWCFWIDGDEIMLWPEYLPDYCARAEHVGGAGGFPLRIVEFDGSVAQAHGRVFRGDKVARFLEGSYQVELHGGMVVALPNEKICDAGGVPYSTEIVKLEHLAELRPPLAGEPHILHRWPLRSPERQAARLHAAEPGWYDQANTKET